MNDLKNVSKFYYKTAFFKCKNSSRRAVALKSVCKACLGMNSLCIKCARVVHEVCNIFLFVCVKRAYGVPKLFQNCA